MSKFFSTAVEMGTTTVTENGDKTYTTSLNACVDMFFQIAAIRGQGKERAWNMFSSALAENEELAVKIALWARDIRGGAGEREAFRNILKYLEIHNFDILSKILHLVPEVGRWDDLFALETSRAKAIAYGLYCIALRNENGLAAKWAPRERKGQVAKDLMECLNMTPAQYRRFIARLTNVVETQMCAKEWDKIKYEHVPSVASARYAKAFGRHDQERYAKYLDAVSKNEKKINTSAIFPHDVLRSDIRTADVMWKNLPDYVKEGINFLPIIDVSGSMLSPINGGVIYRPNGVTCMQVAIALGIYLAERNKSDFKDLAITFSERPAVFKIPQGTIHSKYDFVRRQNWSMSTNLDAAMQLILNIAEKGKVSQEDMPTHLIVLSDMEFNSGHNGSSVAERTKEYFKEAGYKVPNIIWWNIQSRNGNMPVRFNEKRMALISGYSPSIMTSMLNDDLNPVSMMLAAVDKDRYNWKNRRNENG